MSIDLGLKTGETETGKTAQIDWPTKLSDFLGSKLSDFLLVYHNPEK